MSGEASTLYLLHQSGQAVRAKLEEQLRPLGMTGAKYTILGIVARGGASSADISRRLFVTPQTMSEIITDLVERGLIVRKADDKSRRILRLSLTPAGGAALAQCDTISRQVERDAFAAFSRLQLRQFRGLLRELLATMRSDGVAAAPSRRSTPLKRTA